MLFEGTGHALQAQRVQLLDQRFGEHRFVSFSGEGGGLLEVLRAAHVLVREIECGWGRRCGGRLDERAHGAVAVGLQRQGAFAGTLQVGGAEVLGEAQNPLSAAQRLLRVHAALRLGANQLGGRHADCGSPHERLLERALDDGDVPLRTMPVTRAALAAFARPGMRGDDVPVVEHFDAVRGEAHVDAFADQRIGHRVIRAADFNVVIGMNLCLPPLAKLVRAQRQRAQRGAFELFKARAPAAHALLERARVEPFDELPDRRVQLPQREELAVTQARENPALHHQHAGLYLRLVTRLPHPCRQDRHRVVFGEVLIRGVDLRLVAVRPQHPALQVIRNDRARHPAEGLQGAHVAAQPVGSALRPGRLDMRQVRTAEHGDEDLRAAALARVPIDDRHRLAGVIDEELLPRQMVLAQHPLLAREPAPVLIAEHAVLPAIGMRRLVFLPQQQARHAAP